MIIGALGVIVGGDAVSGRRRVRHVQMQRVEDRR